MKTPTRTFLRITPIAILLLTQLVTPAQITSESVSYRGLLASSIERQEANHNLDQAQEALQILRAGGQELYATELAVHLRKNYPAVEPNTTIKVLPEMRETLVLKGDEYARLVNALTPLLKLCWVDKKVTPILFKSEKPVVALSYPNAIIFSTRALAILNDDELEALAAHELNHLIARDLFIQAVDKNNDRTLRLLELFCDAGAASLLQARGKNPRTLITALYKLQQVLEIEFAVHNGKTHPQMQTRDRLNKSLIKEFTLVARR